jgi:hypothetical protein
LKLICISIIKYYSDRIVASYIHVQERRCKPNVSKAVIFLSGYLYKKITVKCDKKRACKFYATVAMQQGQRLAKLIQFSFKDSQTSAILHNPQAVPNHQHSPVREYY